MRNIILILFGVVLVVQCFAQNPVFPGGQDSLFCLIEKDWKGTAIEDEKVNGVILVRFIVDTLGQMQNLEVNPEEIVKIASHLDFVRDGQIEDQVFASFNNLPNWNVSSGNNQSLFSLMLRFPL